MGGGTGLADLVTAGPMFAIRCLKSQQIQSQIPIFSLLRMDNRLLSKWIAGLERTMEFLCKANQATLYYV